MARTPIPRSVAGLPTAPERKFLTERDLAERWGVHPGFLAKLRCKGEGPSYRKFGSNVRYALHDVNAYEDSCQVTTKESA